MRRSTRHGSDSDDAAPESLPAPEPQEERKGHGKHGMSDTSTQVDSSVGVRLYRTNTPWPSGSTEASSEAPTHHEMMEAIPITRVPVGCDGLDDARPAVAYPAKVSSDEPPAYCADNDKALDQSSPRYFQTDGAGHRYTWERPGGCTSPHMRKVIHRPDDSVVLQTIDSPQESASQRNEDAGPCGVCNLNRAFPEQQGLVPAVHGGGLVGSEVCSSHGRRLSSHLGETSDIRSMTVDQGTTNNSTESFSLPDPDPPRITGANRSNQQLASIRRSEALVTQERLQTYEPRSPRIGASAHSQSSNDAANVEIALPGVYHELLEQWQNETDEKPNHMGGKGVFVSPQGKLSQTSLQSTLAMQPALSKGLSQCREEYHQRDDTHTHQQRARNAISMYALEQRTVLRDRYARLTNLDASRLTPGASPRSPQGMTHSHPPTEYSFGLHISLRNVSHAPDSTCLSTTDHCQGTAERDRSRERSQRTCQQRPVHQQITPNNQWAMASVGLGSPLDESSTSSSFTQHSIFSAPANSSSSTTNTAWSPLGSPIDEEVLFSDNWRNEYYMADGKTSPFYPGRGDQPVKVMCRRVDDDGSLRSGPIMNWAPSNRIQRASELIVPTRPRPPRLSIQGGRDREREAVDDYFQSCPAQARRLGG